MASKESSPSLFSRLARLFKSGPVIRRKVRGADTLAAGPDHEKSSGVLLFQKSAASTYASITANAYNLTERLMRYQDFQEMEYTPELASALDIYADETVAQDEKGRVLHVHSDNPRIKEILEDLFYATLNVEFNLRMWARNLCKYGDFFLLNDVSPQHGVVNVVPIPVNELEREENYDRNDPFAVRFRWVSFGNRKLENWEVTHFRLLGNDMFLPYGSSVIEPARRIWRQLILIEDAMLVYRITRAPERRVFYFDVGNMPPEAIPAAAEELRKNIRMNQVIDGKSGRVDLRYNPMSVDEDYYIPVRGSESGTKIDTLAGGQNTAAVEDVEYIQKKMFAAIKIPRAYLGYDEMLSSKATLAQEDIRFSRTIGIIQKTIIAELNKIAIIHLFAHGFVEDDLLDFTLRLSNPSTVAQQQKLELWRSKFEIAGTAPEGMVDRTFLRKEILGLTDEQCEKADDGRLRDKQMDNAIESAVADDAGDAEAGGGAGGGGGFFGGGADDLGGDADASGADDAEPDLGDAGSDDAGELNAGEEADEDEDTRIELLTNADDGDDVFAPIKLPGGQIRAPLKAKNQLQRYLNNRSRQRTHGASKTHIPDFGKMVRSDNDSMTDPFDSKWLSSVVSNPFGESRVRSSRGSALPADTRAMLERMARSLNFAQKGSASGRMLSEIVEGRDVQREIDLDMPLGDPSYEPQFEEGNL